MSEKLRLLTEKIYQEGIEKAREESENMLELAKKEARKIRDEAQEEREDIINRTQEEMNAYRQKVEAEIKLAARKSISKIKQDLANIVQEKVIDKPVKEALSDEDTMASLLSICLGSLKKNEQGNWLISVPDDQEDAIRQSLEKSKLAVLSDGIQLKGKDGLKYGFEVQPEDTNFKIVFNDQTFHEFLSGFMSLETGNFLNDSK